MSAALTVMVVDDDKDLRESVGEVLTDEGHRAVCCEGGGAALEYLRGAQRKPDLILLDLMMPGMNGWEFREAQLEDPQIAAIPIVAMTANRNVKGISAAEVVLKPLSLDKLLEVVERHAPAGAAAPRARLPARVGSTGSVRSPHDVFAGGGQMRALMRAIDWADTPVGPIEGWPASLRSILGLVLGSAQPLSVWWGRQLIQFYNDAYRALLGAGKHPGALGQRAEECWRDSWPVIEPRLLTVFAGGTTTLRDELVVSERHGFAEECYFDFAYSPLREASGAVAGVFVCSSESTERVLAERRLEALGQLAARAGAATSPELACHAAASVLSCIRSELPFALLYLLDEERSLARLCGAVGLEAGCLAAPRSIDLGAPSPAIWPLHEARHAELKLDVGSLSFGVDPLPGGVWPEPPPRALLLPLKPGPHGVLCGFLVAGISPRLSLDERYRGFVRLVASHLSSAIGLSSAASGSETLRSETLRSEIVAAGAGSAGGIT